MLKPAFVVPALLLFAAAAHAQNSTGYTPANPAGCKVWVPLQLHAPDYIPKYTGACSNGFAQGKGELRWMYNDPSIARPKTTWQGFFQNGVYVGDTALPQLVEPQPRSNDYWVHFAPIKAGDVLVIAKADSDGMMDLCAPDAINISLNAHTSATDDTAVKQAMSDAAAKVQAACPSMRHPNTQVNIYTEPYRVDPQGHRPVMTADANFFWANGSLSGYSNRASQQVRNTQAQADRDAKLASSRKRFDDFTTRNHISAWVTTAQLDENPFKYEGKTVGVVVSLDRMLTPDTGMVGSGLEAFGGYVQLQGITPDFPDHTHAVLLAAKVGKREPIAGAARSTDTLTAITRLDSATCTRDGCYDWLDWSSCGDRVPWGEPYTPAR